MDMMGYVQCDESGSATVHTPRVVVQNGDSKALKRKLFSPSASVEGEAVS